VLDFKSRKEQRRLSTIVVSRELATDHPFRRFGATAFAANVNERYRVGEPADVRQVRVRKIARDLLEFAKGRSFGVIASP
jgi:hypothetical protein